MTAEDTPGLALPDFHETHVCRDCGASITIPYARAAALPHGPVADPRGLVALPCAFIPPNEPWSCSVHSGGLRTRLDEPQCDIARPAEPFNDAYLDNVRQSIADGKRLQGHYIIRRLLATIDRDREAGR